MSRLRRLAGALVLMLLGSAGPGVSHGTPGPSAQGPPPARAELVRVELALPPVTTTSSTSTTSPPRPPVTAASRGARRSTPPAPPVAPRVARALNWAALRACESGGNYANRANPRYRGAYQFSYATWAAVGGHGDPADAPPAEQDARAQRLYDAAGAGQWPVCGRLL